MRTKTLLIAAAALAAAVTSSQAQTVYSQNVVGYVNTVLPGGFAFSLVSNPLNGTTNGVEQLMPALQGNELVYIWTGAGYHIYQFAGAGVGTGLGFQSDWEDGVAQPPATGSIPGDQKDTSDGVYWAPQPIVAPGQGFFIQNPNTTETNTFTGTVITTNNVNISGGFAFSLLSSAIPVGGNVQTNQSITLTQNFQGNELVYLWTGAGYHIYQYAGAGVGTGLGFQSDWEDGVAQPPATGSIPGDQTDTSDGVYWAPAPQLNVGAGFFIQNPNTTEGWSQSITNIP